METSEPELIVLYRAGRRRLITSRARQWLAHYFDTKPGLPVRLPCALKKWIEGQKAPPGMKISRTLRRKPFIVERGGKRLVVRLVSGPNPTVLILEEKLISPVLASPGRMGLTRREGEVLLWVARGKTNDDIGDILSISPRTVKKHLEHIYTKLGVANRTAAAALALASDK